MDLEERMKELEEKVEVIRERVIETGDRVKELEGKYLNIRNIYIFGIAIGFFLFLFDTLKYFIQWIFSP